MYNNEFLIGCCYYPEHWDDSDLDKDIKKIKDFGFNVIRMGEFSWSMYEPEEGKYDFSFLEKAVKCARENGLYVILGTPTAAPPVWLAQKYPEVLCVDANLNTMYHGGRQQHNHTSKVYREFCKKIVEKMAYTFKDYDNVIGWQIDNEINCHRSLSYSDSDNRAFRTWLKNKYNTIDELNRCWGTRFWSLEFNDFEQITCPYPAPAYKNPSWVVDFLLFSSDAAIEYAKIQYDILKRITPDKFVTHNGIFGNIDNKKFTDEALDFMSYDSYPAFNERHKKMGGRDCGCRLSMVRGLSDRFLILEQQSGPGGQLNYLLPTPEPGQIRLWTYQSIAHGAEGVLYFRWRTAIYGAEQLWYGIYDHDGKENYRSKEIKKIAEELTKHSKELLSLKGINQVAILCEYHNVCNNQIESFAGDDFNVIYNYLNKQNIKCDFIYDTKDLDKSDYKVVIVPHLVIASKETADNLKAFADNGGAVILSARSGTKDINDQYYRKTPPGVFSELVGAEVEWFTRIPECSEQEIEFNNKVVKAETYYEVLNVGEAEPIATFNSGFYKGKPCFVKNENVYYLGTYFNESSACVYEDIIKKYIDIPFDDLDKCIEVFNYTEYTMFLNYSDKKVSIPYTVHDLLSGKDINEMEGYGVVLVKNIVE